MDVILNHNIRLVKTLKVTNSIAYKEFCKLIFDNKNSIKSDDIIEIELPADELFKKVYGPVKVKFKDSIKSYNLIGVEPRQYLEDCHRSMPISYKGIMIPNTTKDKFKVDLVLRMKG